MSSLLKFGLLLAPDDTGGGGGGADASTTAAAPSEPAGNASEAGGAGASAGEASAPALNDGADADASTEATAKPDAETEDDADAIGDAMSQADDDKEADAIPQAGDDALISDDDLKDILAKIRGKSPEPAAPAAGDKPAESGKDKATEPAAAKQEPAAPLNTNLAGLVDEYGDEIRPLIESHTALETQVRTLTDRLAKAEEALTTATQRAQQEAHQRNVVEPIMRAIDSIPSLNESVFGRGRVTKEQFEKRVALDALAARIAQERRVTDPGFSDGAALEAAHRAMTKTGARSAPPTTREKVMEQARKQAAGRSPQGIATGQTRGPTKQVYSDDDDAITALDKIFANAEAKR